jgi:hypothetical protein
MKTGKNISTLFHENGHRLRVQPSERAWQKLENRLDRRQQNDKVVMMRWAVAVAAMLVLVMGVWLWSVSMKQDSFAILDTAPPEKMEDLENATGCEPYCLVLQARKQLPAYYANPVEKKN